MVKCQLKVLSLFLVLIIVFLVAATSASAKTYLGDPPFRSWMQQCIDRSYVPTPTMMLSVNRSNQPGRSWILPWDGWLYLDGLRGTREDYHVLLHEIGHAFDWTQLNSYNRHHVTCKILRERNPNPWRADWNGQSWIGGEGD